jgi:hypothetical protein
MAGIVIMWETLTFSKNGQGVQNYRRNRRLRFNVFPFKGDLLRRYENMWMEQWEKTDSQLLQVEYSLAVAVAVHLRSWKGLEVEECIPIA